MTKKLLLITCLLCTVCGAWAQTTYYVTPNDLNGADPNDGTTWSSAFTSLQTAINTASADDNIFVKKGIYNLTGTITMKEGVKIYGGFAGSEATLSERVLDAEKSELVRPSDASTNFRIITNNFSSSSPMTSASVLDGFVLRGGNPYGGSYEERHGGAIYNNYASPTLRNLVISGNKTTEGGDGGGMYNDQSSNLVLTNVIISGNAANGNGGGMYTRSSNLKFASVTISGNDAASGGGGSMYNYLSSTQITNSIVLGNSNGIENNSSSIDISYSLVQDVAADATNHILDGTTTTPAQVFVGPVAASNVATTSGDYRLLSCSPAINAGTTPSPTVPTDIIGNNRIVTYDLGAYEFEGLGIDGSTATAMQQNTVVYMTCDIPIARVTSADIGGVSGNTTAKVWIENTQPAQYVKRHYEITPTNDGAGTITLYFTQSEFNDFNAVNTTDLPTGPDDAAGKANLKIEKRNGQSGDGTGLPTTYTGAVSTIDPLDSDIGWNSSLSRWEVSFYVTGFSGFFVKSTNNPLPITLASFEAKRDESTVLLNWETTSEVNSGHFGIERSANGKNWEAIGKVDAMNNSQAQQTYTFKDTSPRSGENLYRLKMVDLDGTYAYSRLRSVTFEIADEVLLYPNPATGPVQVRVNPRYIGSQATLMDGSGKVLRTFTVTAENFSLGLRSSGVYLLRMYDGKVVKVVK